MPIDIPSITGPDVASPRARTSVWVTYASQNPSMGTLRPGTYFCRAHVHVLEAFNSDGSDTLTVGWDSDPDALVTSIDVSTTGLKTVTLGANAGYNGTARKIEAYYENGGSEATTGKVLIVLELFPVPPTP